MRQQRLLGTVLALGLAFGLSACAPDRPAPPTTPEPSATETAPAVYLPEGSAEENQAIFAQALGSLAGGTINGVSVVDAVANVGFPKDAMQVSFDESKTGLTADSIYVSARIGAECLVGQVVTDGGDATAKVMPALGSEDAVCLLGATRPIDW